MNWWTAFYDYDVAYKSKVFTSSGEIEQPIKADMVIEGGTGYDLKNKLPPEVENIIPDYSLYPQFNTAYGFLTRGCPNACPFCIVSKKEGLKATKVADLSNFWNGQPTIKLLDPNLLAYSGHEKLLQQLIGSGAKIDFTQGLDIRLTTPENIELLKRLHLKMMHFAWDNPREDLTRQFKRFKKLSGITDYRKLSVYVLTNYNSSHEEDLYRIETLRGLGFWPYVMIYDRDNAPKITRRLQRWVNHRGIFQTIKSFADYKHTKAASYIDNDYQISLFGADGKSDSEDK